MEELCTSCLCSGRKLFPIFDTGYYELYTQILNEIPWYTMSSQISINICWECRAVLHKYSAFKQQAQSSFIELLRHFNQSTAATAKQSKLNTHHIIRLSCSEIKLEPFLEEDAYKSDVESQITPNVYDFTYTMVDEKVEQDIENKEISDTVNSMCDEIVQNETKLNGDDHNNYGDDFHSEETFVGVSNVMKKKKVKKKDSKKKAKLKHIKKEKALTLEEDSGSELPLIQYKKMDVASEDNIANIDIVGDQDNREIQLETEIPLKPKRNPRDTTVLPDKPTCAECGKKFSSKKTYRYHVRVLHNGQNNHTCPRCGKVYQWKSNLARHLRSHKARDSGELYCDKCDRKFSSVATFRQHFKISKQHNSESDFSFMCNECGKKFVTKTRLRDHIDWEHLKKIKYKCDLCEKAFKCRTGLYIHRKNVHIDDKEKKLNLCHVCGKSYQNAAKLKDHIVAMHSSDTPHRCRECGAAFGWYSSLYRHLREQHHKIKMQPNKKKPRKTKRIPPVLLV